MEGRRERGIIYHMYIYLFEVDALATGIGSSQDLHSPVLQIQSRVIGNERANHQLLQWMSEREDTSHHMDIH